METLRTLFSQFLEEGMLREVNPEIYLRLKARIPKLDLCGLVKCSPLLGKRNCKVFKDLVFRLQCKRLGVRVAKPDPQEEISDVDIFDHI